MLVLLIACGNIASLMLARATTRQHELATRVCCIGASRGRLLQQMLTESITLAAIGGTLGTALAALVLASLRANGAAVLPRASEIRIDPVAALFTVVLSVITGFLVGVGSAIRASSIAARPGLNVGKAGGYSRQSSRIRQGVVVVQIAGSLILLASAAELLDSYWRVAHADAGFDADRLLTAKIALPSSRYSLPAAHQFWNEFLERIRALPNVVAASAAAKLPLDPYPGGAYYLPAGAPSEFGSAGKLGRIAQFDAVADRYFETMRIPILAGETFGAQTSAGGAPAVIVSQSIAKRYPLGGALGMQFDFPGYGYSARVIGIAGDVRPVRPGTPPAGNHLLSPRHRWTAVGNRR